jgi:hypothetical protein
MSRVNRLKYALSAAAALCLLPLSAAAAPSPTPSPSLDTVLAPPPSGFAELTSSSIHGHISAHDYATTADATKAAQIEDTLNKDGYVDGFGNTWLSQTTRHVLVEFALAFTGGRGARSWLTSAEAGDKSGTTYKHADTMTGIDPYYGEHVVQTTNGSTTYGDGFSFVKGNDVFLVLIVSGTDDALQPAIAQTKAQYDAAPSETIPSSQWPENAPSNTPAFQAGVATAILLPIIVVVAIVAVVVGVLVRRSRRSAMPAFAAGAPGAMGAPGTPQMSPDGNYWWDGQTWRDAANEAPPDAQRSSDGTLWWDGRNWRPAPQSSPPEQPPAS